MSLKMCRIGLFVLVAGLALGGTACSAPVAATETGEVASRTPPTATREAPTPTVTPTETPVPPVDPTATPFVAPGDDPAFSPVIFFVTDPDAEPRQRVFPSGVEEVFAVWEYQNMKEGVTVRREWLLNDAVWLAREEPWDFATYGADGAIRDISVFDRANGLGSGQYTLRLYIDGVPQFIDDGWSTDSSFLIQDPRSVSDYPSPGDDARVASVQPPGTLLVRDCESCAGETRVTAPELGDIAWFPDPGTGGTSQHILYTITDRSGQSYGFTTLGIKSVLWVLDAASGQTYPISEGREMLRQPVISPDGKTIALVSGSGWCDAGECELSMLFLKLDADLQPVETISLEEFEFEDPSQFGVNWLLPTSQPGFPYPGQWETPTVFKAAFVGILGEVSLDGIYLLDMTTLTAQRIGSLAP